MPIGSLVALTSSCESKGANSWCEYSLRMVGHVGIRNSLRIFVVRRIFPAFNEYSQKLRLDCYDNKFFNIKLLKLNIIVIMASNSFSQPQLYKCGLCLEYILFENIYLHNCVQNFTQVFITEDNVTFFPQTESNEVIDTMEKLEIYRTKLNETNKHIEFNKENRDSLNQNLSMEEMLIAAVEERPPLWNYKDCLPKDRTNAAKNKLWEEIEEILNPNKENPQYTAAYFKNKWRNLLDTYRVYLSKERTQSGQAAHKKNHGDLWTKWVL
ncbi:uncharacterized protein LOC118646880 isoform X1 [Monomorium pharaonis]|uniref:uncharacterized protein LOC118646880 isoform X1 n=1 Tax=Monomorium pharaonis TaxID=307658 RepID=UPI0017473C1E|nr:uncharacterized protein LOC118646880 isoform X1 [Monomorium pharaonis]XP_036146641.1 uncharacterized protein LOC118646880 isoform X1 [Monomorium pharaonis]XP_036146642.1 uncharacterized protein LOC118646880 isoform X1 [Monomorium pharaonis]